MAEKSTVYLGLGGNLDDPVHQLRLAIETLQNHAEIEVLATSKFYSSKPLGPQDQPDFVNAVVKIETSLTPQQLLNATQTIEQEQGRIKKRHWGERLIDIDILAFENQIVALANLQIPHPQIAHRDFVLLPLQELNAKLNIPGQPEISDMLAKLEQTFVIPLDSF